MKRNGFPVAFAACLLFIVLAGRASAATLSVRADRTVVDLEGQITLTVTVEGGGRGSAEIDLGATEEHFRVYSAGTSQNISFVNGKMSSSSSYNYQLIPRSAGTFPAGPFRVEVDGEEARAAAIQIRVTDAPAPDREKPAPSKTTRSGGDAKVRDAYIRTFLDKKEAYPGEQVTFVFQLFTRIRFWRDPEYSPPSMEGFWKEDLPPQRRFYKEVRGVRYLVNEIRTALFPTRSGDLVVGPASLTYTEDSFFSRDPFEMFSRPKRHRGPEDHKIWSDSLKLHVKPLPAEGCPAGYNGAVGSFRFKANIDKREVEANEPITMTLTLEGTGNIQTATLPELKISDSFKVYDSGSGSESSAEEYRLRGKKTYTRVIVPRYGGEYEIPAVSFSWFDPQKGEYVTSTAGPFPIVVHGDLPVDPAEQKEIERKEIDIRYLKEPREPSWTLRNGETSLALLGAANAAPLLLLGGFLLYRKRRERFDGDRVWARSRRAETVARKTFAIAARSLDDDDSREFAASLVRAVTGFIGDRGNIAARGMTRRELEREMRGRGADPELLECLNRWLNECDRARYSADRLPAEERRRLLSEGEELVRSLGRIVRGRRKR